MTRRVNLDGSSWKYRYVRVVGNPKQLSREALRAMRALRRLGLYQGQIPGDPLPPSPGSTKRDVPIDYDGGDPNLCSAKTKTGRPCRALALPSTGRCKWHGGLSTGPRTPEGKQKVTLNLPNHRKSKVER